MKRWWPSDVVLPVSPQPIDSIIDFLRSTKVLCDAEHLTLAEAAEPDTIAAQEEVLECDRLVEELTVGHDLILEGVSSLIADSTSARSIRQKLRIIDVDHRIEEKLVGDTFKTLIRIAPPLQQTLKRASVRIYANVVEATAGETQRETLGNGNAAAEFQKFVLKRADVKPVGDSDCDGGKEYAGDSRERRGVERAAESEGCGASGRAVCHSQR